MTIIVADVKEKYLSADRYILEVKDLNDVIHTVRRYEENKLKVTPDKHFCYVFCGEQKEDLIHLILNYLLRFEKGYELTGPIEVPPKRDRSDLIVVMSAKNFYVVEIEEKQVTIQLRTEGIISYPALNHALCTALNPPGFVVRLALEKANRMLHTQEVDFVYQHNLTPIKKATKKEIRNATISK